MISGKTAKFSESIIREMTRKAIKYGAVNLSQGLPDIPTPGKLIEAGKRAISQGRNQYSYTWGTPELRNALADDLAKRKNLRLDPDREIVITCGNSEAMIASLIALTEPGDKVLIIEPFYENYLPGCTLSGATPIFARINDDLTLDEKGLKKAFEQQPRLLVLNTPNNPTGKVFSKQEMTFIGELCQHYGTVVITDETYEHIIYDEAEHIAMASIEGMEDMTVTTSSFGKSFCVTGWRVGYAAACEKLMKPIRKVHDYTTICAPTPFQIALAEVLPEADTIFGDLLRQYDEIRNWFVPELEKIGFDVKAPQGAYYIPAGFSRFGFRNDYEFADYLVKEIGVATVAGSSFLHSDKWASVRLTFSRKKETLEEALTRLQKLRPQSD